MAGMSTRMSTRKVEVVGEQFPNLDQVQGDPRVPEPKLDPLAPVADPSKKTSARPLTPARGLGILWVMQSTIKEPDMQPTTQIEATREERIISFVARNPGATRNAVHSADLVRRLDLVDLPDNNLSLLDSLDASLDRMVADGLLVESEGSVLRPSRLTTNCVPRTPPTAWDIRVCSQCGEPDLRDFPDEDGCTACRANARKIVF